MPNLRRKKFIYYLFFHKFIYLFWERQRQCEWGKGRERIPSRLRAATTWGSNSWNCEIMTWAETKSRMLNRLSHSGAPLFFNRTSLLIFLLLKKSSLFYLAFWLCACAFNNSMIFCSSIRKAHLILSQTHLAHMETTIGPVGVFFRFRQPPNSRSHSLNSSKPAWAHTTCRFRCFPNLLGIKVNHSITWVRDSLVVSEVVLCMSNLTIQNAYGHCPRKKRKKAQMLGHGPDLAVQ